MTILQSILVGFQYHEVSWPITIATRSVVVLVSRSAPLYIIARLLPSYNGAQAIAHHTAVNTPRGMIMVLYISQHDTATIKPLTSYLWGLSGHRCGPPEVSTHIAFDQRWCSTHAQRFRIPRTAARGGNK